MAAEDDGTVTVSLKFSLDARNVIEDLKKKAEVESVTQVIQNALRLYKWYIDRIQEGEKICLRKEGDDQVREIELLF